MPTPPVRATSKINLEMESFVFNPRIFLGTIAAAGVLVVTAAVPAMADKPSEHHHQLKATVVVGTVVKPVQSPAGNGPSSNGPAGNGAVGNGPAGSTSNAPAGGFLGALSGIPLIGPLISAFSPAVTGGSTGVNSVTGTLHGLGTGTGLGSVASGLGSAVGGTIDSIAKAIPGGSTVTGLLPGGSVSSTLNGLTGGILNGATNGALSGITNAVPGVGSITNALPKLPS
jgi:hypothetical protein